MRKYTLLTHARFAKMGEEMRSVMLPHTWNALDGQDGGGDYYRGLCTYELDLPGPTPGKRQYIEFRGANHVASVCCNGHELGTHRGGFSTFRFELTHALQPTNNKLKVTVSNEVCDVYPQEADFTFFGGIYREVYFIEVENAHLDLMKDGSDAVFVTPSVSGATRVDVFPVCASGCQVQIELMDEEDHVVAQALQEAEAHTIAELSIPSPRLWQGMEDPYCYKASVSLIGDGKILDQVTVSYGYRSYHVDPQKGFFLNGRSMPLRGVCRHQDRKDMGWAISRKEHEEDMALIREVGANAIRLAHYQHDAYFYDLCDKLGFVVWAEIPYISIHIPGKAAYENTMSQMRELIAQNYNHPSIMMWGIANEITIGGYSEEQYQNLLDLQELCKRMDPNRATVMAQLSRVEIDSPHNEITDLVGYNNYYGWYTGVIEDNATVMDAFHDAHPEKPYGISEYGVDNMVCWHSANPINHDYTEEYACLYHQSMLKMFADRPYLWGTYMWNMFDFAVDRRDEGGVKGLNCKGLVTYDRKIKKDAFYVYQAFWTQEPMVHIAGRRFADRAPQERNITVYTNCQRVTLSVNGEELATVEAVDHAAVFTDVPLRQGENTLAVRAREGAEDTIVLNGVQDHNGAYDLPDLAAALQAGNWFLKQTESIDYGEVGCHTKLLVGELCRNEECAQVLRGWIMSNDAMPIGERIHTVGRVNPWGSSPITSKKYLREIKVLAKYFTEEDFAQLDKKLRCVKRKSE